MTRNQAVLLGADIGPSALQQAKMSPRLVSSSPNRENLQLKQSKRLHDKLTSIKTKTMLVSSANEQLAMMSLSGILALR